MPKTTQAPWNQPVTFNGMEKSLIRWVQMSGINPYTVLGRINRGSTPQEALTKPDQDGNYLHSSAGSGTWNPNETLTIGSTTRTIAGWCQFATNCEQSISVLVEGGLSPFHALTRGRWREGYFWNRYWAEVFNEAPSKLAPEFFADEVTKRLAQIYAEIRSAHSHDPVEFFCSRQIPFAPWDKPIDRLVNNYWGLRRIETPSIPSTPAQIECFFHSLETLLDQIKLHWDWTQLWYALDTEHRTNESRCKYEFQLVTRLANLIRDLLGRVSRSSTVQQLNGTPMTRPGPNGEGDHHLAKSDEDAAPVDSQSLALLQQEIGART